MTGPQCPQGFIDNFIIGQDFPHIPLDFTFTLFDPNTNHMLTYREPGNLDTDSTFNANYIEIPDEVDVIVKGPEFSTTEEQTLFDKQFKFYFP